MNYYLTEMLDFLERLKNFTVDSTVEEYAMYALLAFGILNCFLGYRLLRFWVMVGGFLLGVTGGYLITAGNGMSNSTRFLILAVIGIVLAIISFLVFRAGIFLAGAAIGALPSIYLLRPKSSATFFLCILIGGVLGYLALRFSRVILILATSFMGAMLCDFAAIKLFYLPVVPMGLLILIAVFFVSVLLQLLINPYKAEEDEQDETEESSEDSKTGASANITDDDIEDDDIPIDEEAILKYMEEDHDDDAFPWEKK